MHTYDRFLVSAIISSQVYYSAPFFTGNKTIIIYYKLFFFFLAARATERTMISNIFSAVSQSDLERSINNIVIHSSSPRLKTAQDLPVLLCLIVLADEEQRGKKIRSEVTCSLERLFFYAGAFLNKKVTCEKLHEKVTESLIRLACQRILKDDDFGLNVDFLISFKIFRRDSRFTMSISSEGLALINEYRMVGRNIAAFTVLGKNKTAWLLYQFFTQRRLKKPVEMSLLRNVASLQGMTIGNQNRAIRNALTKIEEHGLLSFSYLKSLNNGEDIIKVGGFLSIL